MCIRDRYVLGRDDGSLYDKNIESPSLGSIDVPGDVLGGEARRSDDPCALHLPHPLGDQILIDRRRIEFLHPPGRPVVRERCDLLVDRRRIRILGPESFEVQYGEPTQPGDLNRCRRADRRIHRSSEKREVEGERVHFPTQVDVLRIPGSSRWNDGDVVEPVGSSTGFCDADVDVHAEMPSILVVVPAVSRVLNTRYSVVRALSLVYCFTDPLIYSNRPRPTASRTCCWKRSARIRASRAPFWRIRATSRSSRVSSVARIGASSATIASATASLNRP